MAKTTFIAPAERTDDLTEWTDINEVAAQIRDLPASYGLMASDLGLERGTEELIRQYQKPDNPTKKAEATRRLATLQLIVLNLMLRSSGYTGQAETEPVKKWDLRMLVGDDSQLTNFGNMHMQSRQSDDSRYADPVSPGEGWWYRMIDYKDNFLTVLRSFRYYDPKPKHGPDFDALRALPRTQWALKLTARLGKQDTYEDEKPAVSQPAEAPEQE